MEFQLPLFAPSLAFHKTLYRCLLDFGYDDLTLAKVVESVDRINHGKPDMCNEIDVLCLQEIKEVVKDVRLFYEQKDKGA